MKYKHGIVKRGLLKLTLLNFKHKHKQALKMRQDLIDLNNGNLTPQEYKTYNDTLIIMDENVFKSIKNIELIEEMLK